MPPGHAHPIFLHGVLINDNVQNSKSKCDGELGQEYSKHCIVFVFVDMDYTFYVCWGSLDTCLSEQA